MINGNEYAWEDVEVTLEGGTFPLTGITEINYEKSKDHTNIYARGADPVAMGRGKNEYSGNMVLLQSEHDRWMASLNGLNIPGTEILAKDITDLQGFGVTVSYAPAGGLSNTDQLTFCRVRRFKKGMKTGDGHQTIDCELVIGKIKYNV